MQKTEKRRTPFALTILPTAAHSRWDAFATECVSWMMTRAERGVLARSTSGEGRLLAIFDVFGDWVNGRDREAASIVDALVKLNRRHPVGRIVARHAPKVRAGIVDLARQAGLVDVEEFAESWTILLKGAVARASEGDAEAPARASGMGRDLIARHRPAAVNSPTDFDTESEFGWIERDGEPRPGATWSSADGIDGGSFDWFDVYGWDGEMAAPVARTA